MDRIGENLKSINPATCKVCGLCAEACPMKIMTKDDSGKAIHFRQDRLSLCMKCGQCTAVCATRSITVDGLAYDKDFFKLAQPQAKVSPGFKSSLLKPEKARSLGVKKQNQPMDTCTALCSAPGRC